MIRLDDLSPGGPSWSFESPLATGVALSRDRVVDELAAADARAAAGEWVVVVVAYEAAPAFDPAMATAAEPPEGIPLLWWQSFADRATVERPTPLPSKVVTRRRRPNRLAYPAAVDHVRQRIALGDVYQANVTDRFDGRVDGTPLDVYRALVGVQSCRFGAYVEMGERVIASASPEMFFEWTDERDGRCGHGGTVTCRPMKGTAPRHPRAGADHAVGDALARSDKDRAENVMIVDLLRNDLGRIAEVGSVTVPELFTLERYETVWQLTSTVRATVPRDTSLVDVFAALFPCGSVTGAPKIAAMGIITELEADPRGVYCGAIGLLSPPGHGTRAVFSVPIRTAVVDPATSTFEYGAGAGITWSSDPHAEDDEVRSKARILTRSFRDVALFETLRVDETGVVHADAHVERLAASAHWFGHPCDAREIGRRLAAIGPSDEARRLRVVLDRTGAVTLEVTPFVDDPGPVRLAIDDQVTRSDDPFCCHKTTWRRHYDEARARHPHADDVVLVNEHGHAVETTIANLAYSYDGRWWCPPLSDGGLAGIARGLAIERGDLAERSIRAADLATCDRLAVLNDLRGWRPAELAVAPAPAG